MMLERIKQKIAEIGTFKSAEVCGVDPAYTSRIKTGAQVPVGLALHRFAFDLGVMTEDEKRGYIERINTDLAAQEKRAKEILRLVKGKRREIHGK